MMTQPHTTDDWMPLPGGELEAPRPKALCHSCRAGGPRALCLTCFRAARERDRRLTAARTLHTATEARFQTTLPFEPVNRARLNQLRAARQAARAASAGGVGRYADRRRRAQIEARHALQRLAEGLRTRGIAVPGSHPRMTEALQAAERQLPESWLPFVTALNARS